MKLGVYVGSFNPVHIGHIKVAKELISEGYIDKCLIVPTLGYWDKHNQIDLKHRINMLKIYENENIIIDTKNNELEFTYQILNNVSNEYKDATIYLIIGSDLIIDFNKWENIDEVLKYNILVVQRGEINTINYINNFKEKDKFKIVKLKEKNEYSSTIIRNNLYKSKKEDILKLIDPLVYEYIIQNKLYLNLM